MGDGHHWRVADLYDWAFDWVDVPAGLLRRGTPAEDLDRLTAEHADLEIPREWFAKEAPRHEVEVPGFAILRTPVTWRMWAAFGMDRAGRFTTRVDSLLASVGLTVPPPHASPDHPVEGVPWTDAAAFAEWAGGLGRVPARLPTEVQWERAARGDDTREYPWGGDYQPGRANLADAGIGTSTEVGSFPTGASPFGVLDLAGNVDEWLADEYAPYPGAPAGVPTVEDWARDRHLTRGGAWFHERDLARCARRHGVYGDLRGVGFRLVRG